MKTEPAIYVACLAAYNSATLHGVWIDANQNTDSIMAEIEAMLADSPVPNAEEWAIHDYDEFGELAYSLGENPPIEKVAAIAALIAEHGDLALSVLDNFHGDIEESSNALENHYLGTYESLAAYAEEYTDDVSNIPDNLKFYIDYERMAREMRIGGDIYTLDNNSGGVYVFSNQ